MVAMMLAGVVAPVPACLSVDRALVRDRAVRAVARGTEVDRAVASAQSHPAGWR